MPLIDETGFITDTFVRVAAGDTLPDTADVIVAAPDYRSVIDRGVRGRIGVDIGASLDAGLALAHSTADEPDLISIRFPAMGDGRGFSIAKALREAGYSGTLRAHGPLIADQFAFAIASGFDQVETTDDVGARQPAAQWTKARATRSRAYQATSPGNILEQRRQREASAEVHAWAI